MDHGTFGHPFAGVLANMPNAAAMMRTWLLVIGVTLWASLAHATTYYVSRGEGGTPLGASSNTCTGSPTTSGSAQNIASPKLTIAQGVACLTAPGDTLRIRGGTYPEMLEGPIVSGTSLTTMTTIGAYNQEVVILKPTSGASVARLVATAAAPLKYLVFDGLILDANLRTGVYGVNHGGTAVDLHHHIWRKGEVRNTGYSGFSGLPPDSELDHMKVHHCGVTNAAPQSHGMYVCPSRAKIHDSEFYRNGAYGMQFYYGDGCNTGTKIYNNKIYENSALDASDFPGGHSAGGMVLGSGDNIEVYNNLFYGNGKVPGAYSGGGIAPIGYGSPNTNIKIYNNTFYNNGGYAIQILAGVPHVEIKNNIMWANDGILRDDSGNSSPLDSSNITVDPKFVNQSSTPPDLRLQATSPARNTGVALTSVTQDLDHNARPQPSGGVYDKGAYEFVEGSGGGGGVPSSPITVFVDPGGNDAQTCQTADMTHPRRTVAGGVACLTVPNSTLYLRAGTYSENIDTATQNIAGGTSWSAPTTIAAYGSETVTLQLPAGQGVVLFMRNATTDHYILFDRLHLDAMGFASSNGLAFMPGTHHLRFQNGEIKNSSNESVYIYNADATEIVTSSIHQSSAIAGIRLAGTSTGTRLERNDIFAAGAAGIRAVNGDTAATPLSGTVIVNNRIHGNGATLSQPGLVIGGPAHTGALILQNLLYGNYAGMLLVGGLSGAKVYNNTIYGNSTYGVTIEATASSTALLNNIISDNSGGNILNNSTTTSQGANLTVTPPFLNAPAGDFQLQATASGAIDQGLTLSETEFDPAGIRRPQNLAYDIGVYEFVGTPGVPVIPPVSPVVGTAPFWAQRPFLNR